MPKTITSKEYFRTIKLIYYAQLTAITLLALVAYYLIQQGRLGTPNDSLALTFQKIIMIGVPLSLVAGYLLFRIILRAIHPTADLRYKMKRYFVANLIRSAFLEIPGLLVSVAALITAYDLFLIIIPFLLIIFLLFRPTRSVIALELNLSQEETAKLNDPKAIISESLQ